MSDFYSDYFFHACDFCVKSMNISIEFFTGNIKQLMVLIKLLWNSVPKFAYENLPKCS